MLGRVAEEYKKRGRIETGYRCMEQMRSHTASRNVSVRIMLFCMTVIMYNLWMHERKRVAHDGEHTLDMMLSYLMTLACALAEMPWAYNPGGG